ncbi:2-oxoacid:ferredoxin oxidoreductase subunit beta, partial [Candidatus Bathyarchaeota archaeon]|nr:2-oxoacid:ferredoxin oxidoreductase subunit beta [Candidatus Bathyarchaeota archaeon]
MLTMKDFNTSAVNTWCPGCGNFAILMTVKQALVDLGLRREEVVAVTGIGCHGKFTNYINVNGIHTIHGRVLPAATAIKLANHSLTVLGFAGDGDAFNIGLGHFAHAARRNVDITYLIHDNLIYGLTTGQMSPTSKKGFVTKTSPRGSFEPGVNPLTQALTGDATFVARTFAGEPKHMAEVLKKAIQHEGFALVDVLQPCVTWNRVNTYQFYKERVYKLEDEGHEAGDFNAAYEKSLEWGERIPIGVFY